jgi:tol-pal system protein YbgF
LDRLEGSARRSSNERPNERPNEKAVERPNLAEAITPPVLPAPALPAPALPVPTSESARPTPFILPPPVVLPPPVSPTAKAPAAPAVIESADGDNSNEEASYLRSLDSLSAGKYDEAIRGFKAQLEQYPRGSYADKAWFWMGDAQYLKRDLRQASSSYGTVIDRFSTSAKVPDALYKQGLCQFEQGQTEAAKTTWRKLVKDYPNSTAASNARKRLK